MKAFNIMRFNVFGTKLFRTDPQSGKVGSLDLNIMLAQLSGVPLITLTDEKGWIKYMFLVYGAFITIFISVLYLFFELYDLVLNRSDLNAMTQNICLSFTHLSGLAKNVNVLVHIKDLEYILGELKRATIKYCLSEEQRATFVKGDFENTLFLFIYACLVAFTGFLCMGLLFYNPSLIAGEVFPFRVALPEWLPTKLKLIYMAFGVMLYGLQVVALDYLNITLMNQLRFQLQVLNLAFNEVNPSGLTVPERKAKLSENPKLISISPKQLLKSIVEHHVLLKNLKNKVETIFRIPVLIQFVTSLVIFAMAVFQAIVSGGTTGAILIYFYCGCVLCELFLYCWFGNDIYEQSKTLSDMGFSCSWYYFDKEWKSSLLLFLTNAQEPFLFTAGGVMSLSLPSFTAILKNSYSFIAVLIQFYK